MCLTGFILFTLTLNSRKFRSHVTIGIYFCRRWSCFLYFGAIGDEVVRASLIAFGAAQIQESQTTSRFCDKVLVVMSLAAIVQISLKILVLQYQDYVTFYVITSSAVFLAAALFLIGWRYYILVKPYDSALLNCIPVYKNAFQVWRHYVHNQRSVNRQCTNIPTTNSLNPFNSSNNQDEQESMNDQREFLILQK